MRSNHGWIYIAKHPSTDRVKIGFSANPQNRIKYLNFVLIAFELAPIELRYKLELDNVWQVEQLVLKKLDAYKIDAGTSKEVFAISVVEAQHAIRSAIEETHEQKL